MKGWNFWRPMSNKITSRSYVYLYEFIFIVFEKMISKNMPKFAKLEKYKEFQRLSSTHIRYSLILYDAMFKKFIHVQYILIVLAFYSWNLIQTLKVIFFTCAQNQYTKAIQSFFFLALENIIYFIEKIIILLQSKI